MLNNLAVKYVHLTVVQMLYVYLTIVYGKNDGAHVRSMPKRSLFWQLGRHDHLGYVCSVILLIRHNKPQTVINVKVLHALRERWKLDLAFHLR